MSCDGGGGVGGGGKVDTWSKGSKISFYKDLGLEDKPERS